MKTHGAYSKPGLWHISRWRNPGRWLVIGYVCGVVTAWLIW
jgi:hypothetical protein